MLLLKMKNIILNKITNGRYLKNLILQTSCLAIENDHLNAVIIPLHFQCSRMTMNNISTSGGLTYLMITTVLYLIH